MEFFQQRFGAEVASRVAFNESVAYVLTGSAATAVLDVCIAVFYLILLFQYNGTLTIIGLSFSLISVLVFFITRSRLLELSMKVQQDVGAPQTALIADRRNKRNTGKNQGDCNDHQKFRQCKRSVPEFFCI